MTSRPKVSVVIPTHNRKIALIETLKALNNQTLPVDQFEVLIADDGSTDMVHEFVVEMDLKYAKRIFRLESGSAAAARNLAANQAKGEIILFLDDDMISAPELLTQHLQCHEKYNKAIVVGRREQMIEGSNNLLEIHSSDPRFQNGYFSFQEAFTCNLSIKYEHWRALNGFDEQFPASGFEDIEFSHRAVLTGFEIIPNYDAVAYHNHHMTLQQFYQQECTYQSSAALLLNMHTELRGQIAHLQDKEPIDLRNDSANLIVRKIVRQILAWRPILELMKISFNILQNILPSHSLSSSLQKKIIGSYQYIGFQEGIRKYGW